MGGYEMDQRSKRFFLGMDPFPSVKLSQNITQNLQGLMVNCYWLITVLLVFSSRVILRGYCDNLANPSNCSALSSLLHGLNASLHMIH
ncbi:hypothetical protein EPI10_024317 [Gossypium australe]|uniref:Uncharacterized protein n=1 Tax=Gossypium australe TaxID=47621 RepID=A0A5B6VYF3_9ROSI|nr:hypothetical protein EPI10_024317 [Gossypium australe]